MNTIFRKTNKPTAIQGSATVRENPNQFLLVSEFNFNFLSNIKIIIIKYQSIKKLPIIVGGVKIFENSGSYNVYATDYDNYSLVYSCSQVIPGN